MTQKDEDNGLITIHPSEETKKCICKNCGHMFVDHNTMLNPDTGTIRGLCKLCTCEDQCY